MTYQSVMRLSLFLALSVFNTAVYDAASSELKETDPHGGPKTADPVGRLESPRDASPEKAESYFMRPSQQSIPPPVFAEDSAPKETTQTKPKTTTGSSTSKDGKTNK